MSEKASKEDAYVFKDEEDNDFEPSFRSLKSERRKSLTLKENQSSGEGQREKKKGLTVAERKLSLDDQPTLESRGKLSNYSHFMK